MKQGTCAAITAMIVGVGISGPASGIVIGVGASDSNYINLGNSAAYNSVGQIYGTDSGGAFAASGVLIAQNWVLTAAHVTSGATSLQFFMDSGGSWDSFATRAGFAADQWYSYSKWTGNLNSGYDIGLFHLSSAVGCGASLSSNGGCAAERYGGTSELNRTGTAVGFGMTGTGGSGATTFDGLKRGGQNTIDAVLNTPGGTNRVLLADFDSGLASDNNFGSSTGLSLEAMIAPGDSGGGLFETINGHNYLVGLTSFGWGRLDGNPDSDYGDVGGWTRVTYFNSWIDSIIGGGSSSGGHGKGSTRGASLQATSLTPAAVPEPGSTALLALAIAALGFARRNQAWRAISG